MELLWVFLAVVATINVSNGKSLADNVSEKDVNKSIYSKNNPSSYVIRKPTSSFFPNMPDKRKKFVINLKPTIKTESQMKSKYSKRLMKKLPIKYVNYEGTSKIPVEVTTRRTLMQKRRFTVKPHDVYAESIRETYNWNGNGKNNNNNLRKPKISNEGDSAEDRFINFKNVDMTINDNDSDEFEELEKNNGYIAVGSQKSNTILRILKRNNTKYSKRHPEQKIFNKAQKNKPVTENKLSDVVNQNRDDKSEVKEKNTVITKESIKSEPNFSNEEKADQNEFIFIKGVKQKDSSSQPIITIDEEMTTDSDLDLVT